MRKVKITADSSCDIGPILKERYDVSLVPLTVTMNEIEYLDGVDIDRDLIYSNWDRTHTLPRTAAINPDRYEKLFTEFTEAGCDIVHISLGSGLSSCYQNAVLAARDFDNVYVIDSKSLSTGSGLLVCEAGERALAGLDAKTIAEQIAPLADKTSASFVIDKLDYLSAGGRCSNAAQVSAQLMNIHPGIRVLNEAFGSMVVGKKYMGKFAKCVTKYVEEQLKGREDIILDRLFITSSSAMPEINEAVQQQALSYLHFREVFITSASSTISAHCGPNTIGVLFLTK